MARAAAASAASPLPNNSSVSVGAALAALGWRLSRAQLLMVVLPLSIGSATAQTCQLTAYARAHAVDFMAKLGNTGYSDFNALNQPAAAHLQARLQAVRAIYERDPDG